MTRVLILTETYFPETGGGESQARALAEGLAAGGASVELLTRRSRPDSPRNEVIGRVQICRRGPSGRGQLKKWALLVALLPALVVRARKTDLILVCGYRILGMIAAPVGRLFGRPCLLKADSQGEHSGEFFRRGLEEIGLSPSAWPVRLALGMRMRLLETADGFVSISTAIRDELISGGVAEARILDIPNGVDANRFRPARAGEREAMRSRLGLPGDARVVAYAGRLVRYKGVLELVEAWDSIRRERPDARLLLVGAGGLDVDACEDELRDRVRDLGLSSSVLFVGAVDDVADHLRAADVFALPSRDEAFGLAAVEAMACGLPLASTDHGGLADIVRHEENGLVVTSDAASLRSGIGRLLDDEGLRLQLGERARRDAVRHFSIEAVVGRYESAIAELAARPSQ